MAERSGGCDPSRLKHLLDDDLTGREQDELVGHLDVCPSCRSRLDSMAAESRWWGDLRRLAAREEPPHPAAVDRPRRATADGDSLGFLARCDDPAYLGRLGPYLVSEVLGRGGMGVVLRAFDPALNRLVAVKVLAPQLATSAAARRRFDREARAAAAVVHDHVTAIHAVDVDVPSGLPYLVMPYLAGRSLQERIDRDGPLEPKEILRIGMQAAAGLAAAHAQGLVHRDVKPSNILLENGVERVKITDFGLARAVDDASLTQSGVVAGTPQYMSPEQARGEPVDPRSDLFSLGSVLYAMAAGHAPFRAGSAVAVLRRVSDEAPRPLREVDPELPEALAAVVEKLHAKDPADRYHSAAEVAGVLGRLLADLQGGATLTRPVAAKATRSRKGPAALVAVAAAGLAIAGGFARFVSPPSGGSGLFAVLSGAGGRDANLIRSADQAEDETIVGSGTPAARSFDLADFTGIDVSGPFQVQARRADGFEVSITADDNVLDHVKVVKDGARLRVSLEQGKNYRLGADSLKATIGLPSLEQVGLTHGAHASLAGFKPGGKFAADLSASSTLDGTIDVDEFACRAQHGSRVELGGTAKGALLTATAGSTLDLGRLAIRDADVRIELAHGSTASLDAHAESRFEAKLTAASTLRGKVEAGEVAIDAQHGSRVALEGKASHARLAATASSTLDLGRLAIRDADVVARHGSAATIGVEAKLNYTLEAASTLNYRGEPEVGRAESSGASSARSARAKE